MKNVEVYRVFTTGQGERKETQRPRRRLSLDGQASDCVREQIAQACPRLGSDFALFWKGNYGIMLIICTQVVVGGRGEGEEEGQGEKEEEDGEVGVGGGGVGEGGAREGNKSVICRISSIYMSIGPYITCNG